MRHRLLLVTLLLLWASKLCFADYELVGTLYPLRWGQQEGSADLVTPPNRLGQPLCVKMGSAFGCRLVGTGGGVIGWKVSSARLVSRTSGQVYWSVTDSGVGNLISPSATYPLPNIPSWVDYARLEMSFVIQYWGPWGPTYYLTPIYSSEEVFIVLDEPKAPMNPAWVSVLKKSCVWARQTNTAERAAELLTQKLWQSGRYDPGCRIPNTGFYTANETDAGETFYLRAFLEDWLVPRGQCNDFADFLLCLVTSLGAYEMKAQRTYSFNVIYWGQGDSDGGGWQFRTRQIDPAGDEGPSATTFTYHQFAAVGSQVWDACFAFVQNYGTALAVGWQRDTTYRSSLVDVFMEYQNHQLVRTVGASETGNPWNPTPPQGFVPAVTANRKP